MLQSKTLHSVVIGVLNALFAITFMVAFISTKNAIFGGLAVLFAVLMVYQVVRYVTLKNG